MNGLSEQTETRMPDRIGWGKQGLVIAFLTVVIGLGIRSLVTADARFGWGMFAVQVRYEITWYRVQDGGARQRYRPMSELRGLPARYLYRAGRSWYGPGAVRCWIDGYLHYLADTQPGEAVAYEADWRFGFNLQPLDREETLRVETDAGARPR